MAYSCSLCLGHHLESWDHPEASASSCLAPGNGKTWTTLGLLVRAYARVLPMWPGLSTAQRLISKESRKREYLESKHFKRSKQKSCGV